jgi:hypothetical protein
MEDIHDLPSMLPGLWTMTPARAETASFHQQVHELGCNGTIHHPQIIESVQA